MRHSCSVDVQSDPLLYLRPEPLEVFTGSDFPPGEAARKEEQLPIATTDNPDYYFSFGLGAKWSNSNRRVVYFIWHLEIMCDSQPKAKSKQLAATSSRNLSSLLKFQMHRLFLATQNKCRKSELSAHNRENIIKLSVHQQLFIYGMERGKLKGIAVDPKSLSPHFLPRNWLDCMPGQWPTRVW